MIHDPWADAKEVEHEYGLTVAPRPDGDAEAAMDAVVLAVSHDKFRDIDFTKFTKKNVVIFDIKAILPKDRVDGRL
jgi:UDP-N-acetyl-D-galactosamine dehydrogenase